LAESVVTEAGDFLFVPPGVPHQPRNLSDTEPATAIVARNDPRDEENVVPYSVSSRNRVPEPGFSYTAPSPRTPRDSNGGWPPTIGAGVWTPMPGYPCPHGPSIT